MNIIKYITNKKYRFFVGKISNVEKSIWELDFKISKSRQVREGVRQDRDRAVENKNHAQINVDKETDKDKKAELEQQVALNEDNIKRYEAQMKMIDDQIQGVAKQDPSEEYPDGIPAVVGILETIASLSELKLMYKEFLKQI